MTALQAALHQNAHIREMLGWTEDGKYLAEQIKDYKSLRAEVAHLQAQLDECRKLVAAKDEAFRTIEINSMIHSSPYIPPESRTKIEAACRDALGLTPADLASKVLVERKELLRLQRIDEMHKNP